MKQSERANQLGLSSSTLQRYRNDINMLSLYRINPNNTNKRIKTSSITIFDINQHLKHDLKRPQMTRNDLNRPQSTSNGNSKIKKTKNNLKGGFFHENVEPNDQYLDEL